MTAEELLYRHRIDFKRKGTGGREAVARCPKCQSQGHREPTWSVNLETGAFVCNRQSSCGWTGGMRDLLDFFGERTETAPRLMQPAKPKTYTKPDAAKMQGLTEEHFGWLASRCISREVAMAAGLKGKPGALAFPVMDPDGNLANVKWRALKDKKFWNEEGAKRLPWGIQFVSPTASSLLVLEGELDLLAAHAYGLKDAISLPNGTGDQDWLDESWDWLERFQTIYLLTDMDPAGQAIRQQLSRRLGAWRCRDVKLPHKDLNDCLMAGVPAEAIHEAIKRCGDYTPDKLASAHDFVDAVADLIANREALVGIPTGFQGLDALIKGWRSGELTVWTGQNGSGKSTILGQAMLNVIASGERVCIASMELAVPRYLRWLATQQADDAEISSGEVYTVLAPVVDSLWFVDHVGSIPVESLTEVMTYAARRYGVRHFVVDSLVKLRLKGDPLEAQKRAVEALCDFADEFSAHVHLVCHPRKGESDNDRPDKTAVKGSGDITDLADNVISVHRNKTPVKDQPSTVAAVLKNREHGLEGACPLYVHPESKRVCDFDRRFDRVKLNTESLERPLWNSGRPVESVSGTSRPAELFDGREIDSRAFGANEFQSSVTDWSDYE